MFTKNFALSFLVLLLPVFTSAQTIACDNPLLDTFNLTALSAPQSAASLPLCNDLKVGHTCCSNDTVTSFQTILSNLLNRLQTAAALRDAYVVELQNEFLTSFQQLATNLTSFSTQITTMQTTNPLIGNTIATQRDEIERISTALNDISINFQSDLQGYQQARVNCFQTLLQVQASALCLACDSNYSTQGVQSDGTLLFSDNLCTTISQACYPLVQTGETLNPLMQARQVFDRAQNLIDYIAEFVSTGTIPNRSLEGDVYTTSNATQRTVIPPPGCTAATSCSWQCQNLFSSSGVLNERVVENGAGLIGGGDITFESILATTSQRRLQGVSSTTVQSEWNPIINSTGLNFNITADPGNAISQIAIANVTTTTDPVAVPAPTTP